MNAIAPPGRDAAPGVSDQPRPHATPGVADTCAATCPVCGEPNHCQLAAAGLYKGACWCGGIPVPAERLRRLPEHARCLCLCRRCLEAVAAGPDAPLLPGRDFHPDPDGRWVLTAQYLLRRGECCDLNCRHCPWRALVLVLVLLVLAPATFAQTALGWHETFETGPSARGWEVTGATNLFVWRPDAGDLQVTWNSANANSYFRRALPVPVSATNDLVFSFSLRLESAAGGVHPGRPGPFQIALGLQRRAAANQPGFLRGTAKDSPDLVEWNWFPDTGFGATVSPVIVSTAGSFFPAFTLQELIPGVSYTVTVEWNSAGRLLRAVLDSGGDRIPVVSEVSFPADAGDFAVDAFAIASYSDAGQTPPEFAGSLLATGLVDNVSLWVARPAGPRLALARSGSGWRVSWTGWPGWTYRVEGTDDPSRWSTVGEVTASSPGPVFVDDPRPAGHARFYRVVASGRDAVSN